MSIITFTNANAYKNAVAALANTTIKDVFNNPYNNEPVTISTASGSGETNIGDGFITGNATNNTASWVDCIGNCPNGYSYDTTSFSFGDSLYGIAGDWYVPASQESGLSARVGNQDVHISVSNGFFGFITDESFSSLTFYTFDKGYQNFQWLQPQVAVDPPPTAIPEPGTAVYFIVWFVWFLFFYTLYRKIRQYKNRSK